MKLIIAGSRSYYPTEAYQRINEKIRFFGIEIAKISEIVNGGNSKGADRAAVLWAKHRAIPIKFFYPPYATMSGKIAPLYRNTQMVEYSDAMLVIWDGISNGSMDITMKAKIKGIPVYVHDERDDRRGSPELTEAIQYDNGFFSEVLK